MLKKVSKTEKFKEKQTEDQETVNRKEKGRKRVNPIENGK